jgi:hypothetical protein
MFKEKVAVLGTVREQVKSLKMNVYGFKERWL